MIYNIFNLLFILNEEKTSIYKIIYNNIYNIYKDHNNIISIFIKIENTYNINNSVYKIDKIINNIFIKYNICNIYNVNYMYSEKNLYINIINYNSDRNVIKLSYITYDTNIYSDYFNRYHIVEDMLCNKCFARFRDNYLIKELNYICNKYEDKNCEICNLYINRNCLDCNKYFQDNSIKSMKYDSKISSIKDIKDSHNDKYIDNIYKYYFEFSVYKDIYSLSLKIKDFSVE